MKCKHASIDDLQTAQELLTEYYEAVGVTRRDTPEETRAFLTDPHSGMWLVHVDEAPAGCVVLRPLSQPDRASECKRLFVRSRFRGRGIAGLLLDEMERFAREIGSDWVYLDSKDDLQDALRLYRARGYRECERYNDNPQATVFLRKGLKAQEERPSS